MNLMPIAQRLEDAGLGEMAKTIFINMIPAEAPNGILLRNPLAGTKIDHEMPGYYKTRFQVIVRAATYAGGEALINSVSQVLTMQDEDIPAAGMFVKYMRPETMPVVFPLSKGNLLEFSINFNVVFCQ